VLIWNNEDITVKNRSLLFQGWFNHDIYHILSLFDVTGNMLTYAKFLARHGFLVPPKEFNLLMKAIPPELTVLVKSHLIFGSHITLQPSLFVDGITITDRNCNDKHIC